MDLYLIAIPRSEWRSAQRLRDWRGAVVLANRLHVSRESGRALCGTAVPLGGEAVAYPEHPDREGWMWRLNCKRCLSALTRLV